MSWCSSTTRVAALTFSDNSLISSSFFLQQLLHAPTPLEGLEFAVQKCAAALILSMAVPLPLPGELVYAGSELVVLKN